MSGTGESRSELLSWLNDLLKLDYKKIEQCGTGAVYCQIMDSIYLDLPMHRVKFRATAEYEYLTNFKILQSCLTKHRIEKTVPVERLVKCRFQDNLEFLQWIKSFWIQNKDESAYDAESRRKNKPLPGINNGAVSASVTKKRSSVPTQGRSTITNSRTSITSSSMNSTSSRKFSNEKFLGIQTELSQTQKKLDEAHKEINQYQVATKVLERERDFYFGKLRDIEILVQTTQDLCKEGVYKDESNELNKFLIKVQQILYATEDGFEVNNIQDNNAGENNQLYGDNQMQIDDPNLSTIHNLITDDETF